MTTAHNPQFCMLLPPADEGEQHKAGVPSHAASQVDPQQHPPVEVHALDAHAKSLMESLRRPRHPPAWWGKEYAELQASTRHNWRRQQQQSNYS